MPPLENVNYDHPVKGLSIPLLYNYFLPHATKKQSLKRLFKYLVLHTLRFNIHDDAFLIQCLLCRLQNIQSIFPIYLFICLVVLFFFYQYGLMNPCLFNGSKFIIYFGSTFFLIWLVWLFCHCDIPHHSMGIFLLIDITQFSRFILYLLCSSPGIKPIL